MTTKAKILEAIKKYCFECSGWSHEGVKNCSDNCNCPLFPFRLGDDPKPAKGKVNTGKKRFPKGRKIGNPLIRKISETSTESDEKEEGNGFIERGNK